jgi:RNA polymerase sigma factor (sigma-70 family)
MADTHLRALLRHVRRVANLNGPGAPSDAELLDRFLVAGDRAAFELLTWRHGPMVFGVCRRVLRHEQDAEDAFQATFLALARKGGSVARRGAVGGWLYTVAYRVALAAKARAGRTPPHAPLTDVPARPDGADWCDVRPVLDEEIGRLPDRYRVPFVLCYLEGLTVDEAARRLGQPRGTVGTRLARARERLRARLTARGVGLSALALTSVLANEASAGLPAGLAGKTLAVAAAGSAAPAPILTLAEGVLRAMFLSQLKSGVSVLVTVVALGAGGLALQTQAQDRPPAAVPGMPAAHAGRAPDAARLGHRHRPRRRLFLRHRAERPDRRHPGVGPRPRRRARPDERAPGAPGGRGRLHRPGPCNGRIPERG